MGTVSMVYRRKIHWEGAPWRIYLKHLENRAPLHLPTFKQCIFNGKSPQKCPFYSFSSVWFPTKNWGPKFPWSPPKKSTKPLPSLWLRNSFSVAPLAFFKRKSRKVKRMDTWQPRVFHRPTTSDQAETKRNKKNHQTKGSPPLDLTLGKQTKGHKMTQQNQGCSKQKTRDWIPLVSTNSLRRYRELKKTDNDEMQRWSQLIMLARRPDEKKGSGLEPNLKKHLSPNVLNLEVSPPSLNKSIH